VGISLKNENGKMQNENFPEKLSIFQFDIFNLHFILADFLNG